MQQLGSKYLSMSKIDAPIPCVQSAFDEKIRKLKEQKLRDAIISCGYLPEQVIDDRVRHERFELRNLYFEPAGIHQYILVDKLKQKQFLLMEDMPSTGIELGYTTFHNKELPYNYYK
ncbi:hypothetical protein D0T53_10960 [Dysgonomonas sp. 216]|nr:hypothetical protein [Dysgonomonas sp. 216]